MHNASVERGIELLNTLFELQCEKDGIEREKPLEISLHGYVDDFCLDINRTMAMLTSMTHTAPAYTRLSQIGKALIIKGCIIHLEEGDTPADAALKWIEEQLECIIPISDLAYIREI